MERSEKEWSWREYYTEIVNRNNWNNWRVTDRIDLTDIIEITDLNNIADITNISEITDMNELTDNIRIRINYNK